MQIPVYLILGFLDAGKSQFVNGVLAALCSFSVRRGMWNMTPRC